MFRVLGKCLSGLKEGLLLKEILEIARQTYFVNKKIVELFELWSMMKDLQQRDMDMTQYFSTLTHY